MGGSIALALFEKPVTGSMHYCQSCRQTARQYCVPTLAPVLVTGLRLCPLQLRHGSNRPCFKLRYVEGCACACCLATADALANAAGALAIHWETTWLLVQEAASSRDEQWHSSAYGAKSSSRLEPGLCRSSSYATWTSALRPPTTGGEWTLSPTTCQCMAVSQFVEMPQWFRLSGQMASRCEGPTQRMDCGYGQPESGRPRSTQNS